MNFELFERMRVFRCQSCADHRQQGFILLRRSKGCLNKLYLRWRVFNMAAKKKGSFMVEQILKFMEKDLSTAPEEGLSRQNRTSQSQKPEQKIEQERRIVLRRKQRNKNTLQFRLSASLKTNHIFKLMGFMGINEQSIENPDCEESFIFNYFQNRSIQKVMFYEHAVVIELPPPVMSPEQPGYEYLVQKFKARGDSKFYEIGELISKAMEAFKQLEGRDNSVDQKPDHIKKWLDHLGDSMFMCCFGINKLALSKSLLTYLEYDLQEFAVSAIKHKTIFIELFSSMNYTAYLLQSLKVLSYLADLMTGKMTFDTYMKTTDFHYSDFIISKNHVKSYCEMSVRALTPGYAVHTIDRILYRSDDLGGKAVNQEKKRMIEDEQKKARQLDFRTVNKINNPQSNQLDENLKKMAGYKQLQRERPRESQDPREEVKQQRGESLP